MKICDILPIDPDVSLVLKLGVALFILWGKPIPIHFPLNLRKRESYLTLKINTCKIF
ncbi:MAG: hypothetical protein CM15mP45_16290 [Deltaproteobacteria bacterium]|nr:MAG: hypothetical protein CM15mP45_16290 [Deltaproteobacteria bacterium]